MKDPAAPHHSHARGGPPQRGRPGPPVTRPPVGPGPRKPEEVDGFDTIKTKPIDQPA